MHRATYKNASDWLWLFVKKSDNLRKTVRNDRSISFRGKIHDRSAIVYRSFWRSFGAVLLIKMPRKLFPVIDCCLFYRAGDSKELKWVLKGQFIRLIYEFHLSFYFCVIANIYALFIACLRSPREPLKRSIIEPSLRLRIMRKTRTKNIFLCPKRAKRTIFLKLNTTTGIPINERLIYVDFPRGHFENRSRDKILQKSWSIFQPIPGSSLERPPFCK